MDITTPSRSEVQSTLDHTETPQRGLEGERIEDADIALEQHIHIGIVGSSRRRKITIRVIQVGIVVLLIGLWQYMASGSETLFLSVGTPWRVTKMVGLPGHKVATVIPGIAQWLASWATNGPVPHGRGWADLLLTMEEAAYGYVLGVTAGILLGAFLGSSRWLRSFAAPFIAMLNAFPKIALAPLFILIFGSSLSMKAYFVAAGTFFITFYAVFSGIRSIDPVYLRNARILGAGRLWLIREVYFPAIIGWITAGLRLTAAWSLSAAVIVEFLAANNGMGFVVNFGQQTDNLPQCFGGLFIVAVVALIVDRTLFHISRHFSAWRLA